MNLSSTLIAFGALASLCLAPLIQGQLTTATVSGTVTDATGAAIANSTVRLENVTRGVARSATSEANGGFSFGFVEVGTYRLTVSQTGFSTVVRPGLELSA